MKRLMHLLLSLLFVGSSCLTTLRGEETNDPASDSAAQTNQFQTDPFVTSGKTEGAAAAYQYVFGDPQASDTQESAAARTVHAFLVPLPGYNLVTANDDDQTVCYGDAIRLWHQPTDCYLHNSGIPIENINFLLHPESSLGHRSHQLVTLLAGRDRSYRDQRSCWWIVKGPQGSNDTELMGKPINLSTPLRFFASNAYFTEYSLCSYSYEKYRRPSPIREKDFEDKYGIKQEVVCWGAKVNYNGELDVVNYNWELLGIDKQPLSDCKLGSNIFLRHVESQKYLRATSNITIPITGDQQYFEGSLSKPDYEVSAVTDPDGDNSMFKIALIARPPAPSRPQTKDSTEDSDTEEKDSQQPPASSPSAPETEKQREEEDKPEPQADTPTPTEQLTDKEWLKAYLSKFDTKKRYKIVTDQYYDGKTRKSFPEEHPFYGGFGGKTSTFAISKDPIRDYSARNSTSWSIRVDAKGGYLGIQAGFSRGNHSRTLQQQRNEKKWDWAKAKWKNGTWTHNVRFKNDNFIEYEKWRPVKVDDQGWIYLQNKSSKWFMLAQKEKGYAIHADSKKKIRIKIVAEEE